MSRNISGARIPEAEIYVLDVATGELDMLVETDQGFRTVAAWSPSGDQIAFSGQLDLEGIWVVNADGSGEPRFLSDGLAAAWSPTGEEMAVFDLVRDEEPGLWTRSLWILDLRTGDKRLVFSRSAEFTGSSAPAWSPDGTRLAFGFGVGRVSDPVIEQDIYILDLTTGTLNQMTHGGLNGSPTWSPDGSLIAYVSARVEEDTIIIAHADGSCSVEALSSEFVGGIAWSPDGERIAFGGLGAIYVLDIATVLGEDFLETGPVCP